MYVGVTLNWLCNLTPSEIPLLKSCSSEITTKGKQCLGGKIGVKITDPVRLGRRGTKLLVPTWEGKAVVKGSKY